MTNALGTGSLTGYSVLTDAGSTGWVMESFQITGGGTVNAVRLWVPSTGLASAMGASPTGHIWRSGNVGDAQTFTLPVTNTAGWVTITLSTPFTVADGEYIGVEYQALNGNYVAKTATLPLTNNGIAIKGGHYRGEQSNMTADAGLPASTSDWSTTSYGIDLEVNATPLSQLAFTVTKTDSTHVSIAWTASDTSITDGISIVRCAGDQSATNDGAGKAPGASGYDPTTISGATTVASAVTSSPYADTVPSAGVYTYWINRTA